MQKYARFVQSTPILLLLSCTIIFFVYECAYYFTWLTGKSYNGTQISSLTFIVFYNFFWFFLLPVSINRFIFKEDLKNLGLRLPIHLNMAIFASFLLLALLIPITQYLSSMPAFQHYYSFKSVPDVKFVSMQFIFLPLYYF